MTDEPGSGWWEPYRYMTLVILAVILVHALLSGKDLRAMAISIKESNAQHVDLGVAIERIVTKADEQNYLLDQLLPEGRRVGLTMPPTLRRQQLLKEEERREYRGEPWGRRRPAAPLEPRWTVPEAG